MTISTFNALTFKEQQQLLIDKGVYIACLNNRHYELFLYQLDAFYIEVWYHKKMHKVVKQDVFNTTEKLTPYLFQIDLSDILVTQH